MIPLLFLHPGAPLDLTRPSIHLSTVIGLAVLGGLYWWRALRLRADAASSAAGAAEASPRDGVAQRVGLNAGVYATAEPTLNASVYPHPKTIPTSSTIGGLAHGSPPTAARRTAFAAGLLVIFASLNGPIHDLSDYYLFSAHMVQHLLLTLLAAPLLVYGTTGEMLRPLLRNQRVFALARWITRPALCFALFNIVIAFWHLPFAYNAAMANHGLHIVQHLMLIAASVLMWWPLMSPLPELPRLPYPGQMLYCFLMVIPMSVVAIFIALSDTILYPAYASAPRMWGLTPMMDQHIGGLIMWIPGGLFFYVIMTIVFFRWARRGEDTREAAQIGWQPATKP